MHAAQKARPLVAIKPPEAPVPSPILLRELEEAEQARAVREEAAQRPAKAPQSTPRPFAYD